MWIKVSKNRTINFDTVLELAIMPASYPEGKFDFEAIFSNSRLVISQHDSFEEAEKAKDYVLFLLTGHQETKYQDITPE